MPPIDTFSARERTKEEGADIWAPPPLPFALDGGSNRFQELVDFFAEILALLG